jgi:hypothetical protein
MQPSFFTHFAERAAMPPRLFIIVDTEEEFDWSAPFARENVSVTAIQEVGRLQKVAPFQFRPQNGVRGDQPRTARRRPRRSLKSRAVAPAGLARICTRG